MIIWPKRNATIRIVPLFLMVAFYFSCQSELEIPLKVSKNFWYKYENAKETEWSFDSIYTVTFTLNRFPKEASFKANGEWIKTISFLPPRRSMICVQEYIESSYKEAWIRETVFVETPDSESYLVTIEAILKEEASDTLEINDEFEDVNNDDSELTDDNESTENLVLKFDADCGFVGKQPIS